MKSITAGVVSLCLVIACFVVALSAAQVTNDARPEITEHNGNTDYNSTAGTNRAPDNLRRQLATWIGVGSVVFFFLSLAVAFLISKHMDHTRWSILRVSSAACLACGSSAGVFITGDITLESQASAYSLAAGAGIAFFLAVYCIFPKFKPHDGTLTAKDNRTRDEASTRISEQESEKMPQPPKSHVDGQNETGFRQLHGQLAVNYPGEWVAIRGNKLVDHHPSKKELKKRISTHADHDLYLVRQVTKHKQIIAEVDLDDFSMVEQSGMGLS